MAMTANLVNISTSTNKGVESLKDSLSITTSGVESIQQTLFSTTDSFQGIKQSLIHTNDSVEGIRQSLISTNDGVDFIKRSFALIDQSIRDFASPKLRVEVPIHCQIIPYPKNERFFGREKVLAQMEAELLDVSTDAPRMRSFALHGMPGVGKTQTALQFTHQHQSNFDAIFWVSCSSPEKISQGYVDIARLLILEKGEVLAHL